MAVMQPYEVIISDPAIRNGKPILVGTRIAVTDLVASHLYRGLTPDEIATNYRLSLAQVYAALAFYYQNRTDVDAVMHAEAAEAEDLLNEFERAAKLIRLG